MKILKRLGLVLALLIVLLILIGFFLPRHVKIERSRVMKAEPQTIYHLVNDLHAWKDWSPWFQLDTAVEMTFGGPSAGSGAFFTWSSKNPDVGQGKLSITKSVPNDTIEMTMDFMQNGLADAAFYFNPTPEGTEVTWAFSTDLGNNPLARYFGLLMERFIGTDYERGLLSLSDLADKSPSTTLSKHDDFSIEVVDTPPMLHVSIVDTCSPAEIAKTLGVCYGSLMQYLGSKGVQPNGPPLAYYHAYNPQQIVVEAALPFEGKLEGRGRIRVRKIDAGRAVMASFRGAYEKTELAHTAIQKWMAEEKKAPSGSPFEVYITDPMLEKDTAKWLTQVYYPL